MVAHELTWNCCPNRKQVSDKMIRMSHTPLFALSSVFSLITLAISASLVAHYNDVGYPNISYRDRIRILLAASIWSLLISLVFLGGVIAAP